MAVTPQKARNACAVRIGTLLLKGMISLVPIFPGAEGALCFDCPAVADFNYSSGGYCIHEYTSVGTSSFQKPHPDITDLDYLVIGGGGGGAGRAPSDSFGAGGAGGAGGMVEGSMSIDNSIYSIVVGAGGAGGAQSGTTNEGTGTNGNDSSFGAVVARGGGGGGTFTTWPTVVGSPGLPGGSGGGGGLRDSASGGEDTQTSPPGGTGYGHAGGSSGPSGSGLCGPYENHAGGGGGGAGIAGSNGGICDGGDGGDGRLSLVTGGMYAGGGGGAGYSDYGLGGFGGGGNGAPKDGGDGMAGTANTGGGGGGSSTGNGGNGGSGIVVVRYEKPVNTITVEGPVTLNVGDAIITGGQGQSSDEDSLTARLGWVSVVDGGTNCLTVAISSGAVPAGMALTVSGEGFNVVTLSNIPQTIKSGLQNDAQDDKTLTYTLEVTDFDSLASTATARTVTVEYSIKGDTP